MSIDWSKAPEGATHFSEGNPRSGKYPAWWRPCQEHAKQFECWAIGTSYRCEKWQPGPFFLPDNAVKREWTGEGLPPVGTVCEFASLGVHAATWRKVEILAHFMGNSTMVAVYVPVEGDRACDQAIAQCFRPIRTPEQIAAEEREKVIKTMIEDSRPDYSAGELLKSSEYVECAISALYDAGYRKRVAP